MKNPPKSLRRIFFTKFVIMKKIFLFLTLILAFCATVHAEQRNLLQNAATEARISQALVTDRAWVPYPAYADRAGWDAMTGANRQQLVRRGEKALDYEWKVIRATDYMEYERSGNRRIMEERNNANVKMLADLVVAELAEGRGRFTDQIVNGVFHLCEMTSWSISAHVVMQKSKRALPGNEDHVLDLVSCEVGAMLAWIDYFFGEEFDRIDPSISKRIRGEVRERIMETYMTEERFWWMGFTETKNTMNNWNPWCNSNVLQCFLLLEENPEKLAQAVYRTMTSVDVFLNYIKGDGACEEGPAYWDSAAGKAYDYLQVLAWATGGKVSLFGNKMIRDMGEYISRTYVGNGWVVNFADASAQINSPASLVYRYGKAVNSDEMMRFAALLVSEKRSAALGFGRDMLRNIECIRCYSELAATPPALPSHAFTWYPETEFCYMRDGRLFLAAKGGHNNESHNHNDVGTFILYVDNEPVFLDAGVGTYTRQTFGKERYSIWTMQSDYHNLPRINGFAQRNGAQYKATEVTADGAVRTFSADIAGAYPSEAGIRSWRRSYQLTGRELVATDDFALRKPSEANELRFMTRGSVDISKKGEVRITTPTGQTVAMSYDDALFTPQTETIELTDARLSNVWGGELVRLTLRAKQVKAAGRYTIRMRIAE